MFGISKNTVFFLLISIFFVSCEMVSEFRYDDKFTEPKLLIHGFLNQGGIKVQISHTVSPLHTDASDTVRNAVVKLFENNVFSMNLIEKQIGYFETPADFIPVSNSEYTLYVEAPGFETASSTPQKLNRKVVFDTCYFTDTIRETWGRNVVYAFSDAYDEQNSYFVDYYTYINGGINKNSGNLLINPLSAFDDFEFNGTKIYQSQYISTILVRGENDYVYADSVKLFLYSFSPDLKTFCESMQEYDATRESPMYDQPSPVYSNIKGGFGIFASFSVDSVTLY